MLCPKCGALLEDNSAFCTKCGNAVKEPPTLSPAVQQPPPDAYGNAPYPLNISTYLAQNIILTCFSLFCCLFLSLPTAVTGLVFSGITAGALRRYDIARAQQYSRLARIFMWISFGLAVTYVILIIIIWVININGYMNIFDNIFRNFDFDRFPFDQSWN